MQYGRRLLVCRRLICTHHTHLTSLHSPLFPLITRASPDDLNFCLVLGLSLSTNPPHHPPLCFTSLQLTTLTAPRTSILQTYLPASSPPTYPSVEYWLHFTIYLRETLSHPSYEYINPSPSRSHILILLPACLLRLRIHSKTPPLSRATWPPHTCKTLARRAFSTSSISAAC